jgi:type IV pilus assembly protein PilW
VNNTQSHYLSRNTGFTLIEFLVAVVLGIILVGGVASVYIGSKRSFIEVEQVGSLTENASFALQMMNDSLRHIGFFGPGGAINIGNHASLDAIPNNCTGAGDAFDLSTSMFAVLTIGTPGTALGCVTDAVPGTTVLVLKYLAPSPIYDEDPDDPNAVLDGQLSFPTGLLATETYVVVNSEYGQLQDGADSAPDVSDGNEFARAIAWPYRFQIYYVRDNDIPTLAMKTLAWDAGVGGVTIQTQDLVPGVENFYLRFGADNDNDGEVDAYTNLTTNLNTMSWDRVVSMETYILVRSITEDPRYVDDKTYNLGDFTIVPSADSARYPQNVRRLMMQSNISLRNPKLIIRGGA